jgi:hypothetical protein
LGILNPPDKYNEEDYSSYEEAVEAYEDAVNAYESTNEYQAYLAYQQYLVDYVKYIEELADYNYFVQNRMSQARKNTIVKTASFNTKESTGFGTPVIVSTTPDSGESNAESYRFLPKVTGEGKIIFFAETNQYSKEEQESKNQEYEDHYNGKLGKVYTDPATGRVYGEGDPFAAAKYEYSKNMLEFYGKNTVMNFAVKQADGTYETFAFTNSYWNDNGVRLDQIAVTMADSDKDGEDDCFYLAFSTSETRLEDNDELAVKKLYLQKGTIKSDGKVELGNAALLRSLVDYSKDSSKDGVYSSTVQTEAYEDPYFGNFQFLYGKIGGLTGDEEEFNESLSFNLMGANEVGPEDFLLFEMNGNTYIITEANLASITGIDPRGSIIPFFDAEVDGKVWGNVTIGTDGEGNVSTVHTGAVPYTTNNALYITKYDTSILGWGESRMLAMNHMQIQEDSERFGWDAEKTSAAYYDSEMGGGMDQLLFKNPQIALGQKSDEQGGTIATLLVITQGILTQLTEKTMYGLLPVLDGNGDYQYDEDGKLIMSFGPVLDENKQPVTQVVPDETKESELGIYAVSYGVGQQNIGESLVTFTKNNFVPGAVLLPRIRLKNTGDVAIRGSEANPIDIRLMISGENGDFGNSSELAAWKVKGNIIAGAKVDTLNDSIMDGKYDQVPTDYLPDNLAGRVIYFTVSEDAEYFAPYYFYSSADNTSQWKSLGLLNIEGNQDKDEGYGKFTLGGKAELGFEYLNIGAEGHTTVLKMFRFGEDKEIIVQVDLQVGNRGDTEAENVYLLVEYSNGVDEQGDSIWQPVDLTNHRLNVGVQQTLKTFGVMATTEKTLANGYLKLTNIEDGSNIGAGKGRTVTGTITLPSSYYDLSSVTKSMNLRFTVVSDTPEYEKDNNTLYRSLEARSFFTVPKHIAVALGSEVRLPVDVNTTRLGDSVVTVTEIVQDGADRKLGLLYYDNGILYIKAAKAGSGIIRMSDTTTASFTDVAFIANEPGEGINIFDDNDIFTWQGDWEFLTGQLNLASDQNAPAVPPYRSDLAQGKAGSAFSFTTMASSLDLYFDGEIKVNSNAPGFSVSSFSVSNGQPVTINLGSNEQYTPYTVTITVTSPTARFDKFVETFHEGIVPLPEMDEGAPQIILSKSLPEKDSWPSGIPFNLTAYITDDGVLGTISFDGEPVTYTKQNGGKFAAVDLKITKNGVYQLVARDGSGNANAMYLAADWFNAAVTEIPQWPEIMAAFKSGGAKVTGPLDKNAKVTLDYETGGTTSEVSIYAATNGWFLDGNGEVTNKVYESSNNTGSCDVGQNGYYLVEAFGNDSRKTFIMQHMGYMNTDNPVTGLTMAQEQPETGAMLTYTVRIPATNTAGISSIKINGIAIDISGVTDKKLISGTYPVWYNGKYVLEAQEAAGNVSSAICTVEGIPITCTVSKEDSFNQERNNGRITVSNATGGSYVPENEGFPAQYQGSYQYSLDGLNWQDEPVFEGLTPGSYTLYVGDKLEPDKEDITAIMDDIIILDMAVDFTVKVTPSHSSGKGGGSITITAEGGLGFYEYSIRKADDKTATDIWIAHENVFEDLSSGLYIVSLRDMDNHQNLLSKEATVFRRSSYIPSPTAILSAGSFLEDLSIKTDPVNGVAMAGLDEGILGKAFASVPADSAGVKTINIEIPEIEGMNSYGLNLPATALSSGPDKRISLTSQVGTIELPGDMLSGTGLENGEEIDVTMGLGDKSLLPDDVKAAIGDRPLVQLTLTLDGVQAEWNNPNAPVTVSIPYTPTAAELANPEHIAVWYIDGNGNVVSVPSGRYDAATGTVTFTTTHFSHYAVAYVHKTFGDLGRVEWARKSVEVMASKGIINGTGEDTYSPTANITRADYLVLLIKTLGLTAEFDDNFDDVAPGTYYYEEVGIAKKLGITTGAGNNRFNPRENISRQDMMVLTERALRRLKKLKEQGTASDLEMFTDKSLIAAYAIDSVATVVKEGLIVGSGDNINPTGNTTRAEAAVFLYRIYNKY